MKVLVLGGGVVGVATAYYLAEAGFEVTVIDRNEQVASESSYGNAGLVAPGDSYAWASPEALKAFLKSLYRQDQGVSVKLRRDPRMWSWFWKFLSECTHEQARVNTLRKLRLTLYSRECLNALVSCTGVDYDGNGQGVLYFFRSQKSLDHGAAIMGLLEENGLRIQVVDRDGLANIDPGLKSATANLAGGTFSPMDQTGDSCKFGRGLAAWCAENQGVELAYRTAITGIEVEGGRVARVVTDQGAFAADAFVLAMGCYSPFLAERIGVRLPIYPVKGYSITVPIQEERAAPHVGGVDEDRLVAYSRLGNRLRFTATAEVSGYDCSYQPRNFEALLRTAKELFPKGGDYRQPQYWAGLRPMTPSSVPILGRARYDNFYLNVGHGHLGWTMSCGSGKFVADLVAGRQPEIDPRGLVYGA